MEDPSIPYAKYGSYPIVGHLFAFMRDRKKLLMECSQRYGSYFKIKIFNQRFTMILSYADWTNRCAKSIIQFYGKGIRHETIRYVACYVW